MVESLEALKLALKQFYFSGSFQQRLLERQVLPGLEYCSPSLRPQIVLLDERQPEAEPMIQGTLDRYVGRVVCIRFSPLAVPNGSEDNQEFSLLVDAEVPLDQLMKGFFLPLVVEFLLMEECSAIYSEIQSKWLTAIHKYNLRISSDPSNPISSASPIETVLSTGDLRERGVAYSHLFLLSELITFVRSHQESLERYGHLVRNPLVYQALRVLYAYTLAVRENSVRLSTQKTEAQADQDLVLRHLLQGQRLVSLVELGALKESGAGARTLAEKYPDLRDWLPLSGTPENPVPTVLSSHGSYLHRWQLVPMLLFQVSTESVKVSREVVERWISEGIPRPRDRFLPEDLVSRESVELMAIYCHWRGVVSDPKTFAQFFFPSQEEAAEVQFLRQGHWHGRVLKTPEEVVRQADRLIFLDSGLLHRKDLLSVLELDLNGLARRAWATLLQREGLFRYGVYRLWSLFGAKPSFKLRPLPRFEAAVAPSKPRPKAAVSRPVAGRMALETNDKIEPPPKGTENNQTAIFRILKGINDLDGEIEELHSKWNEKKGSAGALFRKKIDAAIVKELTPRISFASMTAEDGVEFAYGLIEKTRTVCQVPRVKHRYLARYIFLYVLRYRLKRL